MVYFNVRPSAPLSADHLVRHLRGHSILVEGGPRFRLVTHAWVSADDVDKVIAAFHQAMA